MPVVAAAPAAAAVAPPAPAAPRGATFDARLDARMAAAHAPPAAPGPIGTALRQLDAAQARLDGVLAAARRGRIFSAGELLVLQAEAYRFTQTFDVAAKVVEHGVQAVKQAVQTPL
jgi:hypothetical protein